MLIGKDPFTYVQAVAINRKRPIVHGVRDEHGNQLFRKLVWAVVVVAPSDQGRQTMRLVIRENHEIGRSFTRRIGACGIQGSIFAKRPGGAKTAVYLVCLYLNELSNLVLTCSFKQTTRTFDIRADKRSRIQNRAIHMCFSRKIYHPVEVMPRKQVLHLTTGSDVTANKLISRIFRHFFQIAEIPGIREHVVVDDVNVGTSAKKISHEAGANEACAARDENLHCCLRIEAEFWMAAWEISSGSPSCWLATRMFVRSNESNVPASDHQPSTMA